jgi:Do/DeqQ family serine protease
MKQITSMILAGIVGGMITLGGFYLIAPVSNNQDSKLVNQTLSQQNFAQLTSDRVQSAPFDFTAAAELTMPAVVHIMSKQTKTKTETPQKETSPFDFFFGPATRMPKQGTGSGVIIDGEGYIVTNNHVVDFADEITVTLYDQRKFKAVKIGTDPSTDLALLKIEAEDLPVLEYGNSDELKVGEWVLAVGNPFNLTSTVTAGIISAKGRNIDILGGGSAIESFIQTDAAVNPGNSGGALVDDEGRLVGINTAIASQTGSYSGYSFAVPASIVKKVVQDLKEFGTAQRGFMGVSIQSLDSELAKELKISIVEGVHIANVQDGGAADKAGMRMDDVVTKINGRIVKTAPELQELVGRNRPGDELKVEVNRDGKLETLYIILKGADEKK